MVDSSNVDFLIDHLDDEKLSLNKPQLDLCDNEISGHDFQQIKAKGEGRPRWFLSKPKFENSKFDSCSFNMMRFEGGNFNYASFKNVIFNTCFFMDCSFIGANFENVKFLDRNCLNNSDLSEAVFKDCTVICDGQSINFNKSKFFNTKFSIQGSSIQFNGMLVEHSELTFQKNSAHKLKDKYDFSSSVIISSKIIDSVVPPGSVFKNTDLSNTEIIDSVFTKCDFRSAKLFGVELSNGVIFNSPDFTDAEIDRYSLECIPIEQLPNSSRVKMNHRDDIAKLRLMYSGVFGFVSFLLLLLFAAPYCLFIGKLCLVARFHFTGDIETISMIGALGRYIVSGGMYWESEWIVNWFPLTLFLVAFVYNVCRLVLLMKTVSLEHQEKVKGLPIQFDITLQPWWFFYRANINLFVVNSLVVVFHTYHFFLQNVPTGSG